MISDLAVLRDYARNNVQASFTALVNRHLDLVYAAALRQVRSPQLAEEVAESVFTGLASSAGKLRGKACTHRPGKSAARGSNQRREVQPLEG